MGIVYQKDKRTGITYAYESTAYWDKEKKQSLCDGLSVINTYRQKDGIDLFEIVTEIFSRPKPKA